MLVWEFCVHKDVHEDYLICFNELFDVVDYFVINEATITFTGKNKPLYF
ncbi:MAG: hypothetical protein EBU12_05755, partial [Microbacteriaceae bacterium]|nr:hypothetical protein [Microbacteriaceae bacterium]